MLISAVCYELGNKVVELKIDDLRDFTTKEDQFLWAALFEPTQKELQLVFSKLKVHELAFEDLIHGNQIPKIEEYDEDLFVVMKQIKIIDNQIQLGDVYIFAGQNYVVSVRKGIGESFQGTRALVEKNKKLLKTGSGFVLYSIIDAVIDRYFPIITILQKQIEELEDSIFNKNSSDQSKEQLIEKLHDFKKNLRDVNSVILPIMESMHKLFGGRVPEICEGLDNYFRDAYDHLNRIAGALDNLEETANAAIQTTVALITIEENKITKKLASWAAIFAAITFMAGVWGMNFAHMPEINWKYGYLFALGSMVTVSATLRYKFKKAGWM